ncbi:MULTISPECIES: RNA recognition motif domain-containing protein [unclassified Pseudoalteromonas]|uniref:RNA recognition motif domain-containing protein n=1 Tax=unclassified Pseudoalteromonas TaxID=194690 RepID=UPI000CF6F4B1|nr:MULTISPECIES: RNA-binding protein [unclassified Pseudoalteromonas]
MTSANLKTIIITVCSAVLGYVLLAFVLSTSSLSAPLAFALGAALTGILLLVLNGKSNSAAAEEAATDTKTLYVGNLPYRANEHMVKELFEQHGMVFSVRLLKDKHTGKRRGFGFVEVALKDADLMINQLNDKEYQERTLKVREAKQKQDNDE